MSTSRLYKLICNSLSYLKFKCLIWYNKLKIKISKFIKPRAKKIAFSKFSDKIEVTAFKNPNNSVIIVLLNRNNFNIEYNLKINEKIFHDNLDAHAIVTFQISDN